MAIVTLNKAGEDVTVGGSDVEVIGTSSGGEIITVVSGNIRFDPSFNQGGDTIVLPGLASDYTAYRVGAEVVITRDDGAVQIRVPIGTAGIEIQFDGGDSRTLAFDTSTNPPVARLEGQAISTSSAAPTDITPSGPPPVVGYDVTGSNAAVVEGDAGSRSLVFTITLDRAVTAADGPVSLNYVTQNGTADSASDYVTAAGVVSFAVGQQVATVTVQVLGDTVPEAHETLTLQLTGAALRNGPETLTGTITNDDVAVALTSKADNLAGSSGNEVWFAANTDLGAGDKITDPSKADMDTLSLSIDQNHPQNVNGDTITYGGFTLTNVERFEVTQDASENVEIDLSGSTGLKVLASVNSGGDDLEFLNVGSLADIELNNITNPDDTHDVEVYYKESITAGSETTVNVSVIDTNVDRLNIGVITSSGSRQDRGIEIINLKATGDSDISNLNSDDLRDLNVSGDGSVDIDDLSSNSLKSVDASNLEGDFEIEFTNNNFGVTVKGSQGDNDIAAGEFSDTITTNDGDDVIDAGGGNNVVDAGAGDNEVTAGSGSDQITTGDGDDDIAAGDGNNTVNAGNGENSVRVGLGADSVTTGSGDDTVRDAGGDASISTGGGADAVIIGDEIEVGGRTKVEAGEGDDVVTFNADFDADNDGFGSPLDSVDMGGGADELQINHGADEGSFRNVKSAETLTFLNSGTSNLDGNVGEQLVQNAGVRTINALNGGDDSISVTDFTVGLTVNLAGGSDTLALGSAGDTVNTTGLDGLDKLDGNAGVDRLNVNNSGAVTINANGFQEFEEVVLGAAVTSANLTLTNANAPTTGNGLLVDGSALTLGEVLTFDNTAVTSYSTEVRGGAAADTINTNNVVVDTIVSNGGADVITAGGGDQVTAGAGADQVTLTSGNNKVDAGADGDTVTLGTGNDTVNGDAGDDRIVVNATANLTKADTINGGDDTDTLSVQGTFVDEQFTGLSNVEILQGRDNAGAGANNITLEAEAQAGGIRTVNLEDTDADTLNAAKYTEGLTVNLSGGADVVTTGSGADRVVTAATGAVNLTLNDGDDTIEVSGSDWTFADRADGGAGTDTMLLDNSSGPVDVDVDLDNVTRVEQFNVKSSGDRTVGLDADANTLNFRGGNVGSLTNIAVNASALTDTDDTFTVTLEDDVDQEFQFTVTGSATRDVLVREQTLGGSNNNITFNSGAGNDEFRIGALDLGGIIQYDGGDGEDTLFQLSDNGVIQDDDFVGIKNVEVLSGDTAFVFTSFSAPFGYTDGIDAILGAAAADAGIREIRGTAGDDRVTLDAGFDAATLEVTLGGSTGNKLSPGDDIDASATSTAVTFVATQGEVQVDDNLVGGSSDDDVLNIKAGGTSVATGVVGVETINLNGDNVIGGGATPTSLTVDTASGEVAGGTQTINAVGFLDAADVFTLSAAGASAALKVNSGAGNDVITTGTGDDIISAGGGNNTIVSGDGIDTVTVTGNGTNSITTNAGDDKVTGSGGVDTVVAGTGADTVDAGAGNDVVRGNEGADRLNGEDGVDTLFGDFDRADYTDLNASGSNQDEYEAAQATTGRDTINGGAGADIIVGGLQGDNLTGGSGSDTFRYYSRDDSRIRPLGDDDRDTITDFVSGEDVIDLTQLALDDANYPGTVTNGSQVTLRFNGNWASSQDALTAISGTGNDAFLDVVYSQENDTLYIDWNNDGSITGEDMQIILTGVDSLTAADVLNPHQVVGPHYDSSGIGFPAEQPMAFEPVSDLGMGMGEHDFVLMRGMMIEQTISFA